MNRTGAKHARHNMRSDGWQSSWCITHRRRNALAHDSAEKIHLYASTESRAVYVLSGKKPATISRRPQRKSLCQKRKTMRSHSATSDDSLPLDHHSTTRGVSMKTLPIVAIVIACLVSACSSSQQQSSRDRGDEQVNLALLDAELGPDVSRTYQQSTGRDMVNKTLVGPCCQP
jgi:hypothetical protein